MKIANLETFMANAGLRNYLFVRLVTDTGVTGVGEASLEWQEKTVETLCHEWGAAQVVGTDPFDVGRTASRMIRDQYQGGATAMTVISAVEIALWDIVGKLCDKPVYKLFGGRVHDTIAAYANGWYGGITEPADFAGRAQELVRRGYGGFKVDPFGSAWRRLDKETEETAVEIVAKIREAVGEQVDIMVEFHGRLAFPDALRVIRRIKRWNPTWCEEPVAPEKAELLADLRRVSGAAISAGERAYTLADAARLIESGAVDVIQPDVAHCGGILEAKKVAAVAEAHDVWVAPHCSIGPVALAAALHFDVTTIAFLVQETFSDFDVPWRDDLVFGWNPLRNGKFVLDDTVGLGLEINESAIADHPYVQHAFPSLWDSAWQEKFTQNE